MTTEVFLCELLLQLIITANRARAVGQSLENSFLHSIDNFPSRRVAQGHHHGHGVILCRMLHGLPQLVLHLLWQALYVANDTEPHIILHKDLVLKRSKDKSHECCHLVSRTVPVLSRESIECEILYSEACTFRRDATHCLHSGLMAEATLLSAFCSPASIAIHDDSDMLGYSVHIQVVSH